MTMTKMTNSNPTPPAPLKLTASESTHPHPNPPKHRQPRQSLPEKPTCLTFSPLAWLKLILFLHGGDTEVGGFGVSSEEDLLYITDFVTVRQHVTAVTVEFEDEAVADYFDRCVDQGLQPGRFARIWLHTHPGWSPDPSSVDEETFARVFGGCDWAIMFIIGRTGKTFARLQFFAGPGGQLLLPVTVDWEAWPTLLIEQIEEVPGLMAEWIAEYADNVIPDVRDGSAFLRLADDDKRATDSPRGWEDDFDRLYDNLWEEQEAVREFEEEQARREQQGRWIEVQEPQGQVGSEVPA
jgi:proteasome lid subunit RPN8/RPN11